MEHASWHSSDLVTEISAVLTRHNVRLEVRNSVLKLLDDGSKLKATTNVPDKVYDLAREWRSLSERELAAVYEAGSKTRWICRGSDQRTAFHWIVDVYAAWIPGITQAHLRKADPQLWTQLQAILKYERQGRASIPDWFKVPAGDTERLLVPNTKDANVLLMNAEELRRHNERRTYARRTKAKERSRKRMLQD